MLSTIADVTGHPERVSREQRYYQSLADRSERKRQLTDYYIYSYLTPFFIWHKDISYSDRLKAIENVTGLDEKIIQEHIKSLEYSEFLKTPYWSAIRKEILYKADQTCHFCGQKVDHIESHHLNYDNHGLEHKYYKTEIVAACRECHQNEHNIN